MYCEGGRSLGQGRALHLGWGQCNGLNIKLGMLMRHSLRILAVSFSIMAAPAFTVCTAHAEFKELRTPPEDLMRYSEQELNEYGRRMADEVYGILSEVGSPSGNINADMPIGSESVVELAKSIVAERALIQNARFNHGLTKKTYVPTDIDEFKVEEVVLTRPADEVLVASYRVSLPDRTDTVTGTVLSGESMPRLTVLQWNESLHMWQVFSHADFDAPSAAVCGTEKKQNYSKSSFDPEDIALGNEIMDEFVKAMMDDQLKDHVLKGYQYVYASGEKKTKDGPVRTTIKKNVDRANLEAVKSGRLIAIRYDTQGVLTLDDGGIEPDVKPRLFTFYKADDGAWRFIAAAVFSVTQKVASGTKCISPTPN